MPEPTRGVHYSKHTTFVCTVLPVSSGRVYRLTGSCQLSRRRPLRRSRTAGTRQAKQLSQGWSHSWSRCAFSCTQGCGRRVTCDRTRPAERACGTCAAAIVGVATVAQGSRLYVQSSCDQGGLVAQRLCTCCACWWTQGLPSFHHDRAKTDRESTTMLSPWIHFGTISVRHIYYRCGQARVGCWL
jgi:hypothetical protein